jgi:hypothetical protein
MGIHGDSSPKTQSFPLNQKFLMHHNSPSTMVFCSWPACLSHIHHRWFYPIKFHKWVIFDSIHWSTNQRNHHCCWYFPFKPPYHIYPSKTTGLTTIHHIFPIKTTIYLRITTGLTTIHVFFLPPNPTFHPLGSSGYWQCTRHRHPRAAWRWSERRDNPPWSPSNV